MRLNNTPCPDYSDRSDLLVLIFAASMAVSFMHVKIKRHLQIGWRSWLTERVIGQWMNNGRHYLVTHLQTPGHDNPDGRIAEDIRIATDEAIGLCHFVILYLVVAVQFYRNPLDAFGHGHAGSGGN